MRTNLDFTAPRSALVSSCSSHPHSCFGHNSSSYCMPFFQLGSDVCLAALLSLPLELSVSHGKDYLESAAACKRLSDKRPHTQPLPMETRRRAIGRPSQGRRRPPMTTKSAPINGAANLRMPTRQLGMLLW